MYDVFQTAKGSTYVCLPNGNTIRTKRSFGPGQGETDPSSNWCLYTSQEMAQQHLVGPNAAGLKYRLGYCEVLPGDKPGKFTQFGPEGTIVPPGHQAAIAVLNQDGSWHACLKAETTPQVGLVPVEHRYGEKLANGGVESIRHVGNPIVKIRRVTF